MLVPLDWIIWTVGTTHIHRSGENEFVYEPLTCLSIFIGLAQNSCAVIGSLVPSLSYTNWGNATPFQWISVDQKNWHLRSVIGFNKLRFCTVTVPFDLHFHRLQLVVIYGLTCCVHFRHSATSMLVCRAHLEGQQLLLGLRFLRTLEIFENRVRQN